MLQALTLISYGVLVLLSIVAAVGILDMYWVIITSVPVRSARCAPSESSGSRCETSSSSRRASSPYPASRRGSLRAFWHYLPHHCFNSTARRIRHFSQFRPSELGPVPGDDDRRFRCRGWSHHSRRPEPGSRGADNRACRRPEGGIKRSSMPVNSAKAPRFFVSLAFLTLLLPASAGAQAPTNRRTSSRC